jgi:hypothetical protein
LNNEPLTRGLQKTPIFARQNKKTMLKTNALLTTLFIALLISACKKEPIDNNGNDIYALNVLNENAAFETLYDSAHIKNELQGGLYGSIGIEDFEVENNNTPSPDLLRNTTITRWRIQKLFSFFG